MRIMFVISSLRRGGAERVVSVMANYWAEAGHQVFLVTIERKHADAYSLRPEVERIPLNLARASHYPVYGLWNNLARIRRLRKVVRRVRPDVVVSFVTHTNLLVLMALWGSAVPVIVSERLDPSQLWLGAVREALRRWLYPRAVSIVVQTERVRTGMQLKLPRAKFTVIPNLVPAADPDEKEISIPLRARLNLPTDTRLIVAMGRLDPQKGFDMLVEAFGKLGPRYPDWHLAILGEGASRPALEAQVTRLGMIEKIHLPGLVRAARKNLVEADLFVLASRYEGFPNVLLEAMASGLPVVSFDCPSGPSEIIKDGYNGVLVEARNAGALSAAMSALMNSPARRKALGENARQVLERFSLDRIMALWDQLLLRRVACSVRKRA